MQLKDFVKDTLVQISEGIDEANGALMEKTGTLEPIS